MEFDVLTLSRLQFALTIMFHYLFPPLSIGLGGIMVLMEGTYLATKNPLYEAMTKFWTKLFAVNFAMGVATGIVMEFEFGTNWSTYSRFVGDVFGSALAAEGIFAFFLESGFLAVLVFGWDRVSSKMHFFATLMVFLGSVFSSVWIVVANSWQQTPAGFHIVGEGMHARAEITDFWAMVFNPSSLHRLGHVLIGAFIMGAFFVMSISAFYMLKKRHEDFARKSFRIALIVGLIFSWLAPLSGDFQAKTVAKTQPAKLAAFEGLFKTAERAPLTLFGHPDAGSETLSYEISIPGLLSFLVHGDFQTPVTGLDQFAPQDQPPVAVSFHSYHLMVALGLFFIGLTTLAAFFHWRKTLFDKRWILWIFVFAVLAAYAANQAGWVAAEVGRQPWIVYGLLRTPDGLSKAVQAEQVMASIVLFGLIYLLLFFVWANVMNSKIQHGPDLPHPPEKTTGEGLLEAVGRLVSHGEGYSMTEAHGEKED